MTPEELEGNITIGKFIGMEYVNDAPKDYPNGYYCSPNEDFDLPYEPKDWLFHISFNWLMPVIDKIGDILCKHESNANEWKKYYSYSEVLSLLYSKNLSIFLSRKFAPPLINDESSMFENVVLYLNWYYSVKN